MDINAVFPSKYLKASDLQGRECAVTIDSVTTEDVAGQGEPDDHKPILWFEKATKGFVLNKTNANTIAGMYGPETDNWVGRTITLFPTQTDFQGKQVACVRVRLPQAATVPVAARTPSNGEPPTGDDIPF